MVPSVGDSIFAFFARIALRLLKINKQINLSTHLKRKNRRAQAPCACTSRACSQVGLYFVAVPCVGVIVGGLYEVWEVYGDHRGIKRSFI